MGNYYLKVKTPKTFFTSEWVKRKILVEVKFVNNILDPQPFTFLGGHNNLEFVWIHSKGGTAKDFETIVGCIWQFANVSYSILQ